MTSLTPDTPAVDVYGLASRLLTLVVDGFGSRDVTLPKTRYVCGGQLPAYDGEQVTINILQIADGRAGGGSPSGTDQFNVTQYADLSVSIVRNFPVDKPTIGPSLKKFKDATADNLRDVAMLRAILIDIRAQAALVGDDVEFTIPAVRTEGPEGGVVAAVATISVGLYDVTPWHGSVAPFIDEV